MARKIRDGAKALKKIEGWFEVSDFEVACRLISASFGLSGSNEPNVFMEIGIHHGKSFIPFKKVFADEFSIYIACDVFGNQERNLDKSGVGDRDIFEANLRKYASADKVMILEQDSLDMTSDQITRHGLLGFASIDGGHTYQHTLNDLKIVSPVLAPMGIIMIDDVFNAPWCEVGWALGEFLTGQPGVKAFAIGVDKVFLCNARDHDALYSAARDAMPPWLMVSEKFYWGARVLIYRTMPLKWDVLERTKERLHSLSPTLYELAKKTKRSIPTTRRTRR